jgi:hypothetical protein
MSQTSTRSPQNARDLRRPARTLLDPYGRAPTSNTATNQLAPHYTSSPSRAVRAVVLGLRSFPGFLSPTFIRDIYWYTMTYNTLGFIRSPRSDSVGLLENTDQKPPVLCRTTQQPTGLICLFPEAVEVPFWDYTYYPTSQLRMVERRGSHFGSNPPTPPPYPRPTHPFT